MLDIFVVTMVIVLLYFIWSHHKTLSLMEDTIETMLKVAKSIDEHSVELDGNNSDIAELYRMTKDLKRRIEILEHTQD